MLWHKQANDWFHVDFPSHCPTNRISVLTRMEDDVLGIAVTDQDVGRGPGGAESRGV